MVVLHNEHFSVTCNNPNDWNDEVSCNAYNFIHKNYMAT